MRLFEDGETEYCTGGPRYMRSFYLRIRVYAIVKHRTKFIICNIFFHLPRIYAIFDGKRLLLLKKVCF